ncbi:hypothetical protein [Enhygromyxa salina]|uniref:Uncharacterized protein n=1 Tax=Enhygromyxa salina TaxID=215803 RepID=A0A2S9XN77_9BACT|nr:hypothetical protein [Enhygromyxa salina]PRP94324.1 hypothetical protein ENSA7_78610 [Enhygromyxa salina]
MPLIYQIWYAPKDPGDPADVCASGSSLSLTLVNNHECTYTDTAGPHDVAFVKVIYSKDAGGNFPTSNFTITASPNRWKVEPIYGSAFSGTPTSIGTCYAADTGEAWLLTITPPEYATTETAASTLWTFGVTTPPPKLKVIVKRQDLTLACP